MALKEKSVFKKSEYEYESPDGDKYSIVIVEMGDSKYVEVARQPNEGEQQEPAVRWDVDMVHAIADILRKVTRQPSNMSAPSRGLVAPNIMDFRTGVPVRNEQIPVESFNPVVADRIDYHENATGIAIGANAGAPETPEEISLRNKDEQDLAPWQVEAQQRMTSGFDPNRGGQSRVRRVAPGDLI